VTEPRQPDGWRPAPPTSEEFREVIGHFASGVAVITTVADGVPFGTTASAVTSLSLQPPMVVVCMNRDSQTGAAAARSGYFAINVLGEDQHHFARHFAGKGDDKFAGIERLTGPHGLPLLADAVAHIECRTTQQVPGGTHVVFLAEIESAAAHGGAPLAYYRGRFGRFGELD